MKTDNTIRDIALASIKRHSIDISNWPHTTIDIIDIPSSIVKKESELCVVYCFVSSDNWTCITTQRIIGKINGTERQIYFQDINKTDFGLFNDRKVNLKTFKVISNENFLIEFLMETGKPSIAFIYGVDVINKLHEKKVLENNSIPEYNLSEFRKITNKDLFNLLKTQNVICRYKGFQFAIIKENEDKTLRIGSSDRDAHEIFKMEQVNRGEYELNIPVAEIECIWTTKIANSFDEEIDILFGNIIVKENEYGLITNNYYNESIENGEFASFKNMIFQSVSGYNHQYVFKLITIDYKMQELGFIMEKPGLFTKFVTPDLIDYAYKSITFCKYYKKEFVISTTENNRLLIEPYSSNSYSELELEALGFEIINTKYSKWVSHNELDAIWTKTSNVFGFEKYLNCDKFLKQNTTANI